MIKEKNDRNNYCYSINVRIIKKKSREKILTNVLLFDFTMKRDITLIKFLKESVTSLLKVIRTHFQS